MKGIKTREKFCGDGGTIISILPLLMQLLPSIVHLLEDCIAALMDSSFREHACNFWTECSYNYCKKDFGGEYDDDTE